MNRLEHVLISWWILFKKVNIMPKGNFPKIKGSPCNISVDLTKVAKVLPQGTNNSNLVIVKLSVN